MSKRHYPRYDSRKRLSPRTTSICEWEGCNAQAVWAINVQFNYMRGDDGQRRVCEEHRKFPSGPEHLDDWLEGMKGPPAPKDHTP